MRFSLKQKLGAVIYDLPRYLWAMRPSSRHPWVFMRNRDERLSPVAGRRSPSGVRCDWQWTSDLHIAKVFPELGRHLMKRSLLKRNRTTSSKTHKSHSSSDTVELNGCRTCY
jgi:hypothetical protein